MLHTSKNAPLTLSGHSIKRATEGRYLEQKLFSGFQNEGVKLMTPRKQSSYSRPSSKTYEGQNHHRPNVAASLRSRKSPSIPEREISARGTSRYNDPKLSQVRSRVNGSPYLQYYSSIEVNSRPRLDSRPSRGKLYAVPTKSPRHSNRPQRAPSTLESSKHARMSNTFENLHRSVKSPAVQRIFRASSMHVDISGVPW